MEKDRLEVFRERYDWFMLYLRDILGMTPMDFSWKIRWRMRNDRNPLFSIIQDKYLVKKYARDRGVVSADVFHITDKPETIDFNSLPSEYFIKANHGCGWNIFGKDGELYNFKYGKDSSNRDNYLNFRLTRQACLNLCKQWLKKKYSCREWAYKRIDPKIMVEESLEQRGEGFLIDYRCHTFDGVVKAVEIDSPMFKSDEGIIVNPEGDDFKLKKFRYKIPVPHPGIPENFREIVRAAEKLGKGLDYIRVDLYNTIKGVALGEMTVYPFGGVQNYPSGSPDFDQWVGDQWLLPEPVKGFFFRIGVRRKADPPPPHFPAAGKALTR